MGKVVSRVEERKNVEVEAQKNTKQVYINSFEAADIYANELFGKKLKEEYLGCFPYSLELIKLRKLRIKVKVDKDNGKERTDDLINVKFKWTIDDGDKLKEIYESKKQETEDRIKELELSKTSEKILKSEKELLSYFENVLKKVDDNFEGMNASDLRKYLYENGFTIGRKHYVHYKRSAAKSRTGQCLFINDKFVKPMIDWSRMNLSFVEGQEIDLARLLSAECLVSTSIEKTIKIDPHHILIIDDLPDTLNTMANVVEMKNGSLTVDRRTTDIESCLTDGEALLDAGKFEDGQSMMLLRQHMFKAAAFATNLQTFFEDIYKKREMVIPYDEWETENMFHETIPVKNIEMVVTPSCCKFLRFAYLKESKKEMWHYWVNLVDKNEHQIFGVCKHEKPSKLGYDTGNHILQQTSYQMINSMKMKSEDMDDILKYELNYIDKLKNDSNTFLKYLEETKNDVNSNEMIVNICNRNLNFICTDIFRKFKAKQIHNYVKNVRRGKVKLHGDYCVLFGNCLSYLFATVDELPEDELIGNQIYTKLFDDGKELVGFRNPNTSPSNILVARNTYKKRINRYFELSPNVVCVNTRQFPIQRILSGSDYDSDSIVLFDNDCLLNVAHRTWKKEEYPVCVNGITDGEPRKYRLITDDMFKIDNQLSVSQYLIGQIVNAGQLVMSKYWDLGGKGKGLNDGIAIATILSEVAIDLAKKYYNIDFGTEIKKLKKLSGFGHELPIFWKYRGKKNSKKDTYNDEIKCPMNFLEKKLDEIKNAEKKMNIDLFDLVDSMSVRNSNNQQISRLEEIMDDQNKKINELKSEIEGKSDDDEETIENKEKQMRIINGNLKKISRMKIAKETMINILKRASDGELDARVSVLNAIYKNDKETFIECFNEKVPQTKIL
ncbi:hypothetical protein [Sporolactobacillus putidus]|uniref:RNA dependent RNA polymerase n=1 Tax=Sporolactobacillus putidus TaxID=492735 RepID=A0A917S448_9BACL|nr:hypothetical protein [Sporolactobacillus putidus]GGL55722.1 hypothetical protein GCM10007968_19800 [Sporolactobacillus putidus]